MIRLSSRWLHSGTAVLVLAFGLPLAKPVCAAAVEELYAATAPLAGDSAEATAAAFTEALRRVLVKVTGRPGVAADASVLARFGDPAAMVQQFRRDGAGSLWVRFDPAAVRAGLDAAGLPVWGEDRPVTLVWLAYDNGDGERDVLSSGGNDTPAAATLRRGLQEAAEASAVPLLLPLRDSEELAAVSYADVWGEFTGPVQNASARYRADALLIGRARLFPAGMDDVRWTLLAGEERLEWRGGVADGPRGLAERLAQRLALPAGAESSEVRLAVSGIGTLDEYGLVLGFLRGLSMIESAGVDFVAGDTMVFGLRLRGTRGQLETALGLRAPIEPVGEPGPAMPVGAAAPELRYRLVARR